MYRVKTATKTTVNCVEEYLYNMHLREWIMGGCGSDQISKFIGKSSFLLPQLLMMSVVKIKIMMVEGPTKHKREG